MRDEIVKRMEKWQEAPPAKRPKPLRVPDSAPRRRRDMAWRRWGSGRIGWLLDAHWEIACSSFNGVKVANKFKKKACASATSTLACTPVQGLELSNPPSIGAACYSNHLFLSKVKTSWNFICEIIINPLPSFCFCILKDITTLDGGSMHEWWKIEIFFIRMMVKAVHLVSPTISSSFLGGWLTKKFEDGLEFEIFGHCH